MAFSIGSGISDILRILILIIMPSIILAFVAVHIMRNRELSTARCWIFAAIIGGGLGNLIDRIFRSEGVVDFLDFKFYGLFGLDRWPTFNVADSTLVVASIILIVSVIIQEVKHRE